MNTRKARKLIPHRLADVIACLKWHRFKRLHLASNLLTDLVVTVQHGSRNDAEKSAMSALKSAILKKDIATLKSIHGSLQSQAKVDIWIDKYPPENMLRE
jgi:hypothetical protein